jgi:hypothetical protein
MSKVRAELTSQQALIADVAVYLNRRLWPFTALNSWTGGLSIDLQSVETLYLNRDPIKRTLNLPLVLGRPELTDGIRRWNHCAVGNETDTWVFTLLMQLLSQLLLFPPFMATFEWIDRCQNLQEHRLCSLGL